MPDEPPAPLEKWDPEDPDVLHLKLPNKVQLSTIGAVLDKLEPALRTEGEPIPKLLLDMTSTAFCSPTGITIVAAGIEKLFQANQVQAGRIVEPRGRLLRRYLARMNFYRELGARDPEDFIRREPRGFRPVTHVPSEAESPAITRDLVAAIETNHALDQSTSAALKTCMNELVENVFYHAESPLDALVAVQAYKNKNTTEIVIADVGRGIRAALEARPDYRDRVANDCDAIRFALKKNVTTTDDPRRGIGLWVASEIVRRNGGRMLLMSHDGGVDLSEQHDVNRTAHFWPGTLIALEFRMDRPIDIKSVYASDGDQDADSFDF